MRALDVSIGSGNNVRLLAGLGLEVNKAFDDVMTGRTHDRPFNETLIGSS
jgi:hypothetical protein